MLDTVCSFTAVPDADLLDLDWWPLILAPTWKLTGADPTVLEALRDAFDAGAEVNPAYRDHANLISVSL
ncbi:hypothetical protein [Nocardia sp. IFM 10818]